LARVNYKGNMNLIIVSASIGAGLLPVVAPTFYNAFPTWFVTIFHSGITSAALVAVLLNIFFNHVKFARQKEPASTFVEADRYIRLDEVKSYTRLREGDRIEDGRIVDRDGRPVPVRGERGEVVDVKVCEPEDSGH